MVNAEGLRFVHPETKEVIVTHPYPDVSSFRFSAEQITLKLGGLVQRAQINVRGQTDRGQEICHIMGFYIAAQNSGGR